MASGKPLHSESLLNIPLVREAWSNSEFKKQMRGIDSDWKYKKALKISTSGFNPFISSFFYGENSSFSKWLENPKGPCRKINFNDQLVREVLFFSHDYLHWWAYGIINELAPGIGFGSKPVSARNFEDFVFCHLLSEAVATVGLDYWYLSTIDFNAVCDLGSFGHPLTVSYRLKDESEYQRFNRGFSAQSPSFFETLCQFYCDGEMPGFSLSDVKRSPKTLAWLDHEISYGELQRRYARLWFSFCARTSFDSRTLRSSGLSRPRVGGKQD